MSEQMVGFALERNDIGNDLRGEHRGDLRRDLKSNDLSHIKSQTEFLSMLGRRVRRQRDSVRMSRRVLAQRSNVSERYLAQLESGKGNMSISLLRNVSIALEISLAELLETRSSL